ncbi:hypothetical protein Cgig2_021670 [Carnegiea gigantea]|uniref:Uncharacterized protein n=1 Tax=Carnegiea gigantea TaxID=171969 RepID=A0A9Q1QPQ4_9CARY|nr:hypothetical protein Cgig2_021670 [Carnegiea gigantea]
MNSENWIRVTAHDVHMTLSLFKGPLEWPKRDGIHKCGEVIEMMQSQVDVGEDFRRHFIMSIPRQFPMLREWINDKIKLRVGQEFKIEFDRGYLADTLDKTTVTNEEEEVYEDEHRNESVEAEAKALFRDDKATTDFIIINSRLLAEVMTNLEELLPSTRTPPKRVRNVAVESMSDALIRDTPKKSKVEPGFSRKTSSRGMVCDFPQFTPPNFNFRVSQEDKQALPKRVVLLDSEPDILTTELQVLNCGVDNVLTRGIISSAHCISTPLPLVTSSHSLVAKRQISDHDYNNNVLNR